MIKSPYCHFVLDFKLPRTRGGGIQCFQSVLDSAPIFIGVTGRNDMKECFQVSRIEYGAGLIDFGMTFLDFLRGRPLSYPSS